MTEPPSYRPSPEVIREFNDRGVQWLFEDPENLRGLLQVQEPDLAARLEEGFELDRDIEMILDRVFAPAGDQDDVVDAGRCGLFDAILNDRLVDEREHFFGLGLRGGKKARPKAGRGKHGLLHERFHNPASYQTGRVSSLSEAHSPWSMSFPQIESCPPIG